MQSTFIEINTWETLKGIAEVAFMTVWVFFLKPFWPFLLVGLVGFVAIKLLRIRISKRKHKETPK